jgi:aspartate/methionine/tyrosine aminotransferase
LHADEVYCGTERGDRPETPSFWGSYDRLVCTNSLSKAYGLAGLRIGWTVADPATTEELWRRHEYAVIAAAAPSMTLAELALVPERRQRLLDRQKRLTREGWDVLEAWLAEQRGCFSVVPSAATAIGFVHFDLPFTSLELSERLRIDGRVLTAPGSLLGAESHLRIAVGYEPTRIRAALDRLADTVARIALD